MGSARNITVMLLLVACSRRTTLPAGAPPAGAPPAGFIRSGADLVTAMHGRHSDRWYRTLTFVQKSTFFRADGSASRVETWYEAAAFPGRLRIDLGEPARGNGVLYRGDSAYSFQNGQVVDRRRERNPLLILGFDIYVQSPSATLDQLREQRVNLDVLRSDTLYGRRVYVVGAGPEDLSSTQFWVDADRLLFLRLILSDPQGRRPQDIRFEKYEPLAGGWIAEEVRVYSEGRLVFLEEYSNVRANVRLPDDLFIPERWRTAKHWFTP